MKKIFMVSYGGGHSKILVEIYKKINKNFLNFEIIYLAMTTSKKDLIKENLKFKTLENYLNILEINNKEIDLIKDFNITYNYNEYVSNEEHELYNKVCLDELLDKYSFEELRRNLLKYGRRLYLPLKNMKNIIDYEKPDLIITTNAPRFERAALIVGNKMKIPTISIEDLYGDPNETDIKIDLELQKMDYSKSFGKYICVIDEVAQRNIAKQLLNKNKIFITGNPNFDKLVKRKREGKISTAEIIKEKKILYLAQSTKDFEIILEHLKNIMKRRKDITTIVKLHPNQRVVIEETDNFFIENKNLEELILESNLVITEYSTSGIEALILDRKVLSIQLDRTKRCPIPFEKFSNTKIVKELPEIESQIDKLFSEKFDYEGNNFKNLDIAADKIYEIVLKILNGDKI